MPRITTRTDKFKFIVQINKCCPAIKVFVQKKTNTNTENSLWQFYWFIFIYRDRKDKGHYFIHRWRVGRVSLQDKKKLANKKK